MLLSKAFEYKKWANCELLRLGKQQWSKLPDQDAIFFVRILQHTTVVDALFINRILGHPEPYQTDNLADTPTIEQLEDMIRIQDDWLINYVTSIDEQELARVISFQFTDGELGQMSIEEILLHLLTHGSNHRGMASHTLAANDLQRPADTFTRYLHQAEPQRREHSTKFTVASQQD